MQAGSSLPKAPRVVETERLTLRRPTGDDAQAIYGRYASDPEVTVYLAWPRHESLEHTRAFLRFSDTEWARWPAGPYLIEAKADGRLLGSTGLSFDSSTTASTGYVLARDVWGRGYATEVLHAMVGLAQRLGVRRLYALCHPAHSASAHVLSKCGFQHEGVLGRYAPFPNLHGPERMDVDCHAIRFD